MAHVAEARALDVAAGIGAAGPGHRDAIPVARQQCSRPTCDRERHGRLAADVPPPSLIFRSVEPGPIGSVWRPIAGIVP